MLFHTVYNINTNVSECHSHDIISGCFSIINELNSKTNYDELST